MAFTDDYKGDKAVEAHGNTKLHVIHTNDKKQMAISLTQYERHLSLQGHKIVDIDLEYNNEPEVTQKPALCQLSIGKNHPMLLFQMSATERCTVFDNFLADPRYTFAGFSIDGDKTRLQRVNLEKNITNNEHRCWATLPLSMRHIEYASKDAYTATNTREQRSVMAEALLYKQHRTYTRELHDVHLHGNHKLHVICTSKGKGMDKMLSTFRSKLDGMPVKLVGVDVEYTHYVKPQRAAVLQLCVEKECLAYHISAAKDRPMELDKFLMNGEYTFVGFAIEGDKSKLKVSGLEINSDNSIDIQVEWRDP
ncbi:unnamed protein product [Triticum turgidum subsp. durum]|uniref:3'-5' exonuclease domain-containing protein n=1 Tax=Triticum turgidum subsp. durum TaxID=4567 RepID=A0A9R1QGR2_TRITD|nr:unnamed protein product [Triticum turgidum subsp. durum]